ncbi:MAG: hypothetical protein AABZ67_14430 [Pseudomonadota bacterium]
MRRNRIKQLPADAARHELFTAVRRSLQHVDIEMRGSGAVDDFIGKRLRRNLRRIFRHRFAYQAGYGPPPQPTPAIHMATTINLKNNK